VLKIFLLDQLGLQALLAEKDNGKVWRALCKNIEKNSNVLLAASSTIQALIENVLAASDLADPVRSFAQWSIVSSSSSSSSYLLNRGCSCSKRR